MNRLTRAQAALAQAATGDTAWRAAAVGTTEWLAQHSVTLLRLSLGLVFFAFGVLKFVPGLSPAAGLAGATFSELTLGVVPPDAGVVAVARWRRSSASPCSPGACCAWAWPCWG